jgi:hypothetical protein
MVVHPAGAVPTFVTKFQDPPVGVAGTVADSLKINHSKYEPPKDTPPPYKPLLSAPAVAMTAFAVLLP